MGGTYLPSHVNDIDFGWHIYASGRSATGRIYDHTMEVFFTTPPGGPSNLTTENESDGDVYISWSDNSDDETGFRVQFREGNGLWYDAIPGIGAQAVTAANATSFTHKAVDIADAGIENGDSLRYRVRAEKTGPSSLWVTSAALTYSIAEEPPAYPTNCVATQQGDNDVEITWTDNSGDEDRFNLQYREGVSGGSVNLAMPIADSTSYTWSAAAIAAAGISSGDALQFRVRAIKDDGPNSGYSSWSTAISYTIPTVAPVAPSEITAAQTTATGHPVRINWNDNSSDETGFDVEFKIGTGQWQKATTTATNTETYDHTVAALITAGAEDGDTLTYRVRSVKTDAPASAYIVATTLTLEIPPEAPSSFSAMLESDGDVSLTWVDNSANEDGFEIEYKIGADGSWMSVTTTDSDVTAYSHTAADISDDDVSDDDVLTYRVKAERTDMFDSEWVESNTVTYEDGGSDNPETPTDCAAALESDGDVEITWTDNADNEDNYHVQVLGTSGWTDLDEDIAAGSTSYTYNADDIDDDGWEDDDTLIFRVRATSDNDGNSNWCVTEGIIYNAEGSVAPAAPSDFSPTQAKHLSLIHISEPTRPY